ncbi:MAG: hypothetical protein IT204_24100 [Fimbriimonadaceae bacterium]|nr:hypothetical protein [Fimbriimonadaceae bacterium]
MRRTWAVCLLLTATVSAAPVGKNVSPHQLVDQVIAATAPLAHPRGERLPLYLWSLIGLGTTDPAELRGLLTQLDARGLAACASWNPAPAARERSLANALALSRVQQELGLDVNISAIACMYSLCDGSAATGHVDAAGQPFFDTSQGGQHKLGCPFTLEPRLAPVRQQVEYFLDAYRAAGVTVDFIFGDWEIDGPLEWNAGWATARRCVRCRERLPQIDDFTAYQRLCREVRGRTQRITFSEPVLARFPQARVGNYSVYPNDGWRYWYDYFETEPTAGQPCRLDHRAPVRPWPSEFGATGYTFAMPVIYTWYRTWFWYDWPDGDFRWFYNLLQNGSNAGQHCPPGTPLISFVHRSTTSPPETPDPAVQLLSVWAYQELLWHLLLRGHDALFLWSPREEALDEAVPLHQVYAAALEYREFLSGGTPLTFDLPQQPGVVVSGLRLGPRTLRRITDFGTRSGRCVVE